MTEQEAKELFQHLVNQGVVCEDDEESFMDILWTYKYIQKEDK